MIICGDPQCRLQVWIVKDKKLCCRRSSNGMETSRPNLSAISFYGTDNIIAGFFSGSVKKMSWANGKLNFYWKFPLNQRNYRRCYEDKIWKRRSG